MRICFDCLRNTTRVRIDNVEYVEVVWQKDKGRMTRYYKVITKDNKVRMLKYKDHQVYWVSDNAD